MNNKFISEKEKTNDFSFFYKKKKALSEFKKGVMVVEKGQEKLEITPEDPKFLIFFQIIKFKRFLMFLFFACFIALFSFSLINTIFSLNFSNSWYKLLINYFFNLLFVYFFLWSLFNWLNFHNLTTTFNLLSWKQKEIVSEKSWFTDHILMVIPLLRKHINYFLLTILTFFCTSTLVFSLLLHFDVVSWVEFKENLLFTIFATVILAFVFCWLKFLLVNYYDATKILFASLENTSDKNNYANYFSGSNYDLTTASNKKVSPYKKFQTRSQKNKFDNDFIDVSVVENSEVDDEVTKVKKKLALKKQKNKARNKKALNWWFGID